MPNLFCAFGVWLSWSVIAVKIQQMHDQDPSVYTFDDFGSPTGAAYRRLLGSLPSVAGLSGGIMRICNSYMVQVSGGRTVAASGSFVLALPMILCAAELNNPNVHFSFLLVCAVLSGVGGGVFASSMSNMSFLCKLYTWFGKGSFLVWYERVMQNNTILYYRVLTALTVLLRHFYFHFYRPQGPTRIQFGDEWWIGKSRSERFSIGLARTHVVVCGIGGDFQDYRRMAQSCWMVLVAPEYIVGLCCLCLDVQHARTRKSCRSFAQQGLSKSI